MRTRRVDEHLLRTIRLLPCMACVAMDPEGARAAMEDGRTKSHPHHLVSRGAYGADDFCNLMPLCWMHHAEIHARGIRHMAGKYTAIEYWLLGAGWTRDGFAWMAPADAYDRDTLGGTELNEGEKYEQIRVDKRARDRAGQGPG